MNKELSSLAVLGSTALFVLFWGSGAIVSRIGLDHSSALVLLAARFALAFLVLVAMSPRHWLPARGTRLRVALTGGLFIGIYSVCYFLALDNGITPGVLATVLGAQPVLTLLLLERRFSWRRLAGLLLALAGLFMVVYRSTGLEGVKPLGVVFALAALAGMTVGAIGQKRIDQHPRQVLPLQYLVSLAICIALMPAQQFRIDPDIRLLVAWAWLALVISVAAQLLLYRLIHAGNLVNVTSLFYLVPAVTALMDYFVLGNVLPVEGMLGMLAIVAGIALVLRSKPGTSN